MRFKSHFIFTQTQNFEQKKRYGMISNHIFISFVFWRENKITNHYIFSLQTNNS